MEYGLHITKREKSFITFKKNKTTLLDEIYFSIEESFYIFKFMIIHFLKSIPILIFCVVMFDLLGSK
jgi:hypothetical protein